MCVKERGLIELGGFVFWGFLWLLELGKNLALSCKTR